MHSMHTMAKVKNSLLADGDTRRAGRPADRRGAGGRGRRPDHRQHRTRGATAHRALRRRARAGAGDQPRCRSRRLHPRRQGRPATRARARRGRGRGDVRRPDPAAEGTGRRDPCSRGPARSSTRVARSTGGADRRRAVRVPDWRRRRLWSSLPPSSVSATSSASSRRWSSIDSSQYYQAASLVVVPSYNESFGLVAVEAQACGTPVIAANVGGLPTAVADGVTGVLVDGHDPRDYARGDRASACSTRPSSTGWAAPRRIQARQFGWARTAERTLAAYGDAADLLLGERLMIADLTASRHGRSARSASVPSDRHHSRCPRRGRARCGRASPGHVSSSTYPGERKLSTPCRLVVGEHAVEVHAFVCRNPDENHEARLSLAAEPQPAAVRGRVRDRSQRRHLPRRSGVARRSVTTSGGRPTAGVRCSRTPTSRSTRSSNSASPPLSARSGNGGSAAGESTRNLDAFKGWLER